jgi:hypothetical protein
MTRRLAPILALLLFLLTSGEFANAQPMCDWVSGISPNIPNQEWNCNWVNDASGGIPDWVQRYNGTQLPPGPGACHSYSAVSGFGEDIIANLNCPHVFVPQCQMINPYALSLPSVAGPPVGLPSQYACVVYPNPVAFGPSNVSQYVSSCSVGPTPQGSIDVYLDDSTSNYASGHCARVTPPTFNNVEYFLDFKSFLVNGWRSTTNATGTIYIRSIQMGPHTTAAFSSNARVDFSSAWLCYAFSSNSKCKYVSNQSGSALAISRFYTDPSLEAGWKPWSMWFSAGL